MNPVLPYNGTEGYVATTASEARARSDARSGRAGRRQEAILAYLDGIGEAGATWGEVGSALALHHGQVSAALSVLHNAGKVFQLKRVKNRAHPYVHAKYQELYPVEQRQDEPARTKAGKLNSRIGQAMLWIEAAEAELDAGTPESLGLVSEYLAIAKLRLEGWDA